jgi:hypothetical protein
MTKAPHHKAEHERVGKTEGAKKPPPQDEVCELVRDFDFPGYRIVIRCEGHPDVVLLELGDVPTVPVIHSLGSSNARIT